MKPLETFNDGKKTAYRILKEYWDTVKQRINHSEYPQQCSQAVHK
jgi:hypothetical protein